MTLARAFLQREAALFCALPRNAKLLLGTSTVSVFAAPVVNVFVYAFILRSTFDLNRVMAFQVALFSGIPVAFLANRFLVGGRFGFAHLYALGLVLCGAVLAGMTLLSALTWGLIIGMGFLMGLATGLQWANRNYLSLVCTQDRFRNYYFGVESFFLCVSGVVMPALVGAFIGARAGAEGTAAAKAAYQWVAGAVLLLSVGASGFLLRGSFPAERPAIRVRSAFKPVWRKMLVLATLKATVQIFFTTAPAVLIMRVLGGQENALGYVQSAGAVLAAVLSYVIGRSTRPEHRVAVLAAALFLYGSGAVVNAVLFDRFSVLVLMACQIVAQPLLDATYNPILLGALDAVADGGSESRYAYIVSHEIGIFAGRVIGSAAFIALACADSGDDAFRYVLALMALVHLFCWPVAASIRRDLGWRA